MCSYKIIQNIISIIKSWKQPLTVFVEFMVIQGDGIIYKYINLPVSRDSVSYSYLLVKVRAFHQKCLIFEM